MVNAILISRNRLQFIVLVFPHLTMNFAVQEGSDKHCVTYLVKIDPVALFLSVYPFAYTLQLSVRIVFPLNIVRAAHNEKKNCQISSHAQQIMLANAAVK